MSLWSADELSTAIKMAQGGEGLDIIAKTVARSQRAVKCKLHRNGVIRPGKKRDPWSTELVETTVKMFHRGDRWTAIAEVAGCSPEAARNKFARMGFVNGEQCRKRYAHLWLDVNTYRSLNESASARGKTVEIMLSDVANLLADPVLLENVLDDGVTI